MRSLFLILISLHLIPIHARTTPGYLLLVGGGSEKINGWSDSPYGWAVEKSNNKRVAIITYDSDPGTWLPNYFLSLGAVEAKNFILDNTNIANQQETYDSLITYGMVFLKGGDQWKYYEYYHNTLTQTAIQEVYFNGGVIGGTSAGLAVLSTVFFTAENGTVYPEEALEDPFNNYMTLKNDFLDLFPGFIFDSHFVERARFGRLIGFMGNWEMLQDEGLIGIGVDDKTALCIHPDQTSTVYGTGAVSIYIAKEGNDFRVSGEKLLGNNMEVKQLLHLCSINLNTMEYSGLSTPVLPEFETLSHHNKLWLSGSDKIYDNIRMLDHFSQTGQAQDTILVVTGISTGATAIFTNYLEDNLQTPTLTMQALPSTVDDPVWKERIQRLSKMLIIGNDYETFMDFLMTWPNGNLLKDLIFKGEKQVAFVGDNSRFAGKTVLVNYEQEYASYDGLLEYGTGMGILRNAIVIPNTFSGDIDNENAASGVPYGMVMEDLKFGFWLYDDCYLFYQPLNDHAEITSIGDFPMIVLENQGTVGDFSTQSAVNSGEPRDVAGFGEFTLMLMDSTVVKTIDLVESTKPVQWENVSIYPNPASGPVFIRTAMETEALITIRDVYGKVVHHALMDLPGPLFPTGIPPGIYLVGIKYSHTNQLFYTKLIIQ